MIYEHAGAAHPIRMRSFLSCCPCSCCCQPICRRMRAADQPHNLVLANRIRQYIGTHFTEQLTLEGYWRGAVHVAVSSGAYL